MQDADDPSPADGNLTHDPSARRHVTIFGRSLPLPGTRIGRISLGSALVAGGTLGFLPILGFWMLPLGLFILAQDIPSIRRRRRKLAVRFGRRKKGRQENDMR